MTTRIEQIRERAEKATPGPWLISPAKRKSDWPRLVWDNPSDPRAELWEMPQISDLSDDISDYDSGFISHARSDIPWLLERLGEAEKLVKRIEWEDLEDTCPDCMNGKEFGHAADCRLAVFLAALAEGEKEQTDV